MKLIYRKHAIMRMFERGISDENVREILNAGEIIIARAGRGMLPRPKRLKTSGMLRWSLNVATGYIPRRALVP